MQWSITREPDDRLADVRISIGKKNDLGCYIVFRGRPEEVVELLETSLLVAKEALPARNYRDNRGRPQG